MAPSEFDYLPHLTFHERVCVAIGDRESSQKFCAHLRVNESFFVSTQRVCFKCNLVGHITSSNAAGTHMPMFVSLPCVGLYGCPMQGHHTEGIPPFCARALQAVLHSVPGSAWSHDHVLRGGGTNGCPRLGWTLGGHSQKGNAAVRTAAATSNSIGEGCKLRIVKSYRPVGLSTVGLYDCVQHGLVLRCVDPYSRYAPWRSTAPRTRWCQMRIDSFVFSNFPGRLDHLLVYSIS